MSFEVSRDFRVNSLTLAFFRRLIYDRWNGCLNVNKMDNEGFRKYLTDRGQPIPEEKVIENTKIVEKFEKFLKQFGKTLETARGEEVDKFSKVLIEEGNNTYPNFTALYRYANFTKNMGLFIPCARGVRWSRSNECAS